jgi:Tfp pilus assembly protein PilX
MISRNRQQGATLLIALVILVLLALLGLGAYRTSSTDLKASGNMQARTEALNAAQETIETVISTNQFVTDPANALATPCGEANTFCSDYDADGVAEYTTRLTPAPACVSVKVLKMSELDLSSAADLGCVVGQSQQFGVAGAAGGGDSLCANSVWQITAEASSPASAAKVTVTQGVGIRVGVDDMAASCL